MNVYTIINPSDALTMRAPSILIAGLAVICLGQGSYGARGPDGETPVLTSWDLWLSQYGLMPGGLGEALEKHRTEIADALASVLLGSPADRPDVEAALAGLPDDAAREAYILARNNRLRSSLNDIEGRAHKLAKALRE
jgi:hypothetical protein